MKYDNWKFGKQAPKYKTMKMIRNDIIEFNLIPTFKPSVYVSITFYFKRLTEHCAGNAEQTVSAIN